MPRRKKIKLTAEQEAQEKARLETEEMINSEFGSRDSEVGMMNAKIPKSEILNHKSFGINIRKGVKQKSPYLVDLKKSLELEKKEKFNPYSKFKFEQKLESLGNLVKPQKIKKGFSSIKSKLVKEREIKEEIERGKKVISALHQTTQELNNVETPARLAIRSFWISKKLAAVWKFYLADIAKWGKNFYQKHLREIFIANIFALAGFIIYQILKIIYKLLYSLGKILWSMAIIFLKPLYRAVKKMAMFAYGNTKNLLLCLGRIINSAVRKIFRLGEGIKKKTADEIEAVSETVSSAASDLKQGSYSFKFLPSFAWSRQLAAFLIIALILVSAFKAITYFPNISKVQGKVLGTTEEAMSSLQSAAQDSGQWNFTGAADEFSQAAASFSLAKNYLGEIGFIKKIIGVIPLPEAQIAAQSEDLLSAAQTAAQIGKYLNLAFASLQLEEENPIMPLTKRLDEFLYYNRLALDELNYFQQTINKINPEIFDDNIRQEIEKLQKDIPVFTLVYAK